MPALVPPEGEQGENGDEWLAFAVLAAITVLATTIRNRLGLKQGVRCPQCRHRF